MVKLSVTSTVVCDGVRSGDTLVITNLNNKHDRKYIITNVHSKTLLSIRKIYFQNWRSAVWMQQKLFGLEKIIRSAVNYCK
jgi:hypothetical protein